MLLKTQERLNRCPAWQNFTPNEYKNMEPAYGVLLDRWAKENHIGDSRKLFEVRLVNQQSELEIHRSNSWWDDPVFADRLFWVFVKPVLIGVDEGMGRGYPCYALEFFECQYILKLAIERCGYNPYSKHDLLGREVANMEPSFLVPTECCQIEWDDTEAGRASNIREQCIERAAKAPSAEQVEVEAQLKEAAEKLIAEVSDVSTSSQWQPPSLDSKEAQKKAI